MEVRTRFAPSPTGFLHIGSLRSALYEYAFAKHNRGKFILRIEDTDRNRYVEGAAEKTYEQLRLFGIDWDEGPLVGGPFAPYVQSERVVTGIYRKAAEKLLGAGHAYYCFCPPKTTTEIKEAHEKKISELRDPCRNLTAAEIDTNLAAGKKPAIRLKVPDKEIIAYTDIVVKKEISWKSEFVDDVMLLKSDGFPTYQLAVVVDDAAMEISHILRAMEWLPSTPVHLLLFKYLGYKIPEIGHLTDVLDPAGGKLSKRKGNVSTEDFLGAGYLPEAILNYIMLLGWAPKDNREIFSLLEFIEVFDLNGIQKSNAMFNPQKLDWFNEQYIRALDDVDLGQKIQKFTKRSETEIAEVLPLVKDRLVTLKDFDVLTDYFFETPTVDSRLFNSVRSDPKIILAHATKTLEKTWDGIYLESEAREFCTKVGIKVGDYFMVLRIAITGKTATPPLWEVMEVIGKEEILTRLNTALNINK